MYVSKAPIHRWKVGILNPSPQLFSIHRQISLQLLGLPSEEKVRNAYNSASLNAKTLWVEAQETHFLFVNTAQLFIFFFLQSIFVGISPFSLPPSHSPNRFSPTSPSH